MTTKDELGELHEAATLLVGLQEERKLLEEQALHSAQQAEPEHADWLRREKEAYQSKLKGEAYRLAQALRTTNIISEIQATERKKQGFWARVRILLGWE
jgi:hypothetical protein